MIIFIRRKNMFKRIIHICILAVWTFYCGTVTAQQSIEKYDPDELYKQAVELFEREMFTAARKMFEDVMEHAVDKRDFVYSNSQYYAALCAIELTQPDAESLLMRFISDNPNSPKTPYANFRMARYHYNSRRYRRAIERFEMLSPRDLDANKAVEYHFLLGHSYFMELDNVKARTSFFQIINANDQRFSSPALYFFSHINYVDENYDTALEGFLRLLNDESFSGMAPYYIAQIYFLQQRYQQVITFAENRINNVSAARRDEVMRIVGESHYRLGQYKEAIPYLEEYVRSKNPTAEDNYQLGYAYYHTGDCENAIRYFERASSSASSLGQNALVHLGDCYIKTGEKQRARLAFQRAAQMNFDLEAQENAHFNFAVLSYELMITPFNESIRSFNDFITRFPNSERLDQAYNYLVMAYTTTRNYRLAIESIERIRVRDDNILRALQRVTFFRGLELFNDLNFAAAIEMFDKSLENSRFDASIAARNVFWKAESEYRQGNFQQATDLYRRFLSMPAAQRTEEFLQAYYGLGYASFSIRNFSDALNWFQRYITAMNNMPTRTVADAHNRIGDCFFMQPAYWQAIESYEKAFNLNLSAADYSLFQMGITFGLVDRQERKIETLSDLLVRFPRSSYANVALFEMGRSYVILGRNEQAISTFRRLISDFPNSTYVSRALLELGMVHYSMDRGRDALVYYKQVVSDFPLSSDAGSALADIRNVYVDMNDIDGYLAYVGTLGNMVNITISEQDSLTYRAAENIWMSGNCAAAIVNLSNYLERFPEGSFRINANFYLADCLLRGGNMEAALKSFEFVIEQPRNMFTEQALMSASALYFNLERFEESLATYKRLETGAGIASNVLDARIGIMRSLFRLNRHSEAIEAAQTVLENRDLSPERVRETQFIMAQAYRHLNNLTAALAEYRKVATEVSSVEGAESKFNIIDILFRQNNLTESENEIFDFADRGTPHQYWMARSFILLSDIFVRKNDDFQAIHTLQSVIDGYDIQDDGIIELATAKKMEIEERTNAVREVQRDEVEVQIRN